MNTTILTTHPLDLGAGPQDTTTFSNCRWHVDDTGTLHVIREGGRGTAASFATGSWVIAIDDGSLVTAKGGPR